MTYEELRRKSVAELREIARGIDHDAVQGYTQLHKERLLPAICTALGIDMHLHHHVAAGFDKTAIRARMHQLHGERGKALEAHDASKLKVIRRELHSLNHRVRAHTV